MTKTAVIHQPDFLPHLAFFHRLLHADIFVLLDTAQYVTGTSRSWMNRDKIKTPRGEKWITVPVQKSSMGTKISEIYLSKESGWRRKNLDLITENYRTTPFFHEVFPFIEALFRYQCDKLSDFNLQSIQILLDLFNIKIDRVLASTLKPRGKSNEMLVDILLKVKASAYLSGVGAKGYYDPEPFHKTDIDVIWQEFVHPIYPQLFGSFIPDLSSIDLLFNCGITRSRDILHHLGK